MFLGGGISLTEIVVVLVFFIDTLSPVLSVSINAEDSILAAVIVVVNALKLKRSSLCWVKQYV